MPHLLFSTLWRDDIWWRLSALPTHIFYSYLITKPVGSCLHKKLNNKLVSTVMAMLFSALFWALEIALRITCHNVISQKISHCPVLCQTFQIYLYMCGWGGDVYYFPGCSLNIRRLQLVTFDIPTRSHAANYVLLQWDSPHAHPTVIL